MVGKDGRSSASFGPARSAKKPKSSGFAIASSRKAPILPEDTRRYPRAATGTPTRATSKRVDEAKDGFIPEDEVTETAELLALDEVTSVAPRTVQSTRSLRRLPLPPPSAAGEEEDEFTEVQAQKLAAPEMTLAEQILSSSARNRKAQESGLTVTEIDPTAGKASQDVDQRELAAPAVSRAQSVSNSISTPAPEAPDRSALVDRQETHAVKKRWFVVPLVVGLVAIASVFLFKADPRARAVDGDTRDIDAKVAGAAKVPGSEPALALPDPAGLPEMNFAPDEVELAADDEASDVEAPTPEPAAQEKAAPNLSAARASDPKDPRAQPAAEAKAASRGSSSADSLRAKSKTESPPVDREAAQALYAKGTSAFVAGKLAAAERDFQSALRHDPGFALAFRALGLVYERRGQSGKAIGAFRRYLKRAPRAKDADKIKSRIAGLGE